MARFIEITCEDLESAGVVPEFAHCRSCHYDHTDGREMLPIDAPARWRRRKFSKGYVPMRVQARVCCTFPRSDLTRDDWAFALKCARRRGKVRIQDDRSYETIELQQGHPTVQLARRV